MAGAGYLVAALYLFPSPLLPSERRVPEVVGLGAQDAQRELEERGFEAVIAASEPHPTAPAAIVTWQDPPSGVAAPRGARVELTVSTGVQRVAVPDVAGLDLELAQRLVWAAGLRVGQVDSVTAKGSLPGIAVGTSPAARDSLPLGASLAIHLAK